jgi:hypothetical protein
VHLDDKAGALGGRDLPLSAWFRRPGEIPHLAVRGNFVVCHRVLASPLNSEPPVGVPLPHNREQNHGSAAAGCSPRRFPMAARAYWKGYLKLSLVTCPVALYPASSQAEKTRFHQINRKTGHRLRQHLWPPRQLDVGQQLARMMMANPNAFTDRFLAHEAAAGVYLDEGVRRALENNQRQIAEAEQRQREREEREAAEARKEQAAERAAYRAKRGWPT